MCVTFNIVTLNIVTLYIVKLSMHFMTVQLLHP